MRFGDYGAPNERASRRMVAHWGHTASPAGPGQRPKSDRLAPKVLALVGKGRSYRLIGRELG